MVNKIFGSITILIVVVQILFSFYYSSEIINQNNYLNSNQTKLDLLQTNNQELENQLAKITSLNYLQSIIQSKNLIPIKQEINLNQQ